MGSVLGTGFPGRVGSVFGYVLSRGGDPVRQRCVRQDAVWPMGPKTAPRAAQSARRDFLGKHGDPATSMDLCPFLVVPSPVPLKKLTKPNSARTKRTGEGGTAGERCQQNCRGLKVYGRTVTHLAKEN